MAKPELRDHRKFLKLRRLLGEPTPHVMGYLECLWLRGYQTGNPAIGDELDVEAAAEYPGEEGKFAKAVVASGFVDRDEKGHHTIHDLFEHAPAYVQKRMVRKNTAPNGTTWDSVTKVRKGKNKLESSPNGLQNVESQSERTAKPQNGQKADDKDKNQEPRNKKQEPKVNDGVLAKDAAATNCVPVLTFPTVGEPAVFCLQHALLDEWADLFPNLDIYAECRHALAWVKAEASRAKPASDMPKFLVSWLGRSKNQFETAVVVHNTPRSPPKTFDQIKAEQNSKLFDDLRANAVDAPGRIASRALTAIEGPR